MITGVIIVFQVIFYSVSPFYKNINMIILMLFSILTFSIVIQRNKLGIERLNSLLPFSTIRLGLTRSIFILASWVILIAGLYSLNKFLFPSVFDEISILIGQLGFSLILISSFVILQDIYMSYSVNNLTERLLLVFFYFTLLSILTTGVIITADYIDPKLISGNGIYVIYLWGIVTSGLSILSFNKRRTYL